MSTPSKTNLTIARHNKKVEARATAEEDEMLARLMNHVSFDDEKGTKRRANGSLRPHPVFGAAALRLENASMLSGESPAAPNVIQSWVEDTRKARAARRSRRGVSSHEEENAGSGPRSSTRQAPYLTRNKRIKVAKTALIYVLKPKPEVSITMPSMPSMPDPPQMQSLEVQIAPSDTDFMGEISYSWDEVKSLTSTLDDGSAPCTPPPLEAEASDAYDMGGLEAALKYAMEASYAHDASSGGNGISSAQEWSATPLTVPNTFDDRKHARATARNERRSGGSAPYNRASKQKKPCAIVNDLDANLQEPLAFQKKARFEATTDDIPIGVQNANSADEKPKKKKKPRMTNCDILNWTQNVAMQVVVY